MEIVQREYKVYNFSELSRESKDYAINKWYEIEDYPFLENDILEEMKQIDSYFENVKLQYSLSYCQGDGLCFSGTLDLTKFLNGKYSVKLPEYKKRALREYIYSIHSKGNKGRYCYANKNQIDYTENYCDGIERKNIQKLWENVLTEIEDYYIDICYQLEKYGYSILEYRMNDEEFSDFCNSNEYQFFENGKMFDL